MALKIFNTLSRRLESFEPLTAGKVRMYTCGPTVYDYAHIGNFRAYLFEDLLRRYLQYSGYQVTQIMNLTDVDDKTIQGSQKAGLPLAEYTRHYKEAFFADIQALNIEAAEAYPAATEHIPEMIALIETLFKAGVAYRSEDGSVYFSIAKFPAYGRLAQLDLSELRPGARVAQDEYQKDNLADFALWKAWSPADGPVGWEAPWGRGRPGWHIECSAMSMKYLGPSFDLHTGGVDNIFPHHEDEIAQSEAATGQPFVKYWMHCAHLVVEGRKMSKSLGNFFTLRDLRERGYNGREIRYALLSAHYRQTLNFSFAALTAARAALQRLDEFQDRLAPLAGSVQLALDTLPPWVAQQRLAFEAALDDDLNMPLALAALFELVHAGHRRLDTQALSPPEAAHIQHTLSAWDRVLGFLAKTEAQPDAAVTRLATERQAARAARQWQAADRLRQLIAERGWIVQDTPQGFQLKPNNLR